MQQTLDEILRQQASVRPGAAAISAPDGRELTYCALLDAVGATAARLGAAGLGPADRVAVALPNGPEMAVAVLGAACAASCAPLNPACTRAEQRALLVELGARALIAPEGMRSTARDAAAELGVGVIEFPADVCALCGGRAEDLRPADPPDIALVLHTSGTTARPKIVALSHANLCAAARNVASSLRLGPADRCLSVMPLFHVHGLVGALLATLYSGGTAICTSGFDADRFADWLVALRPTWYTAVPTMHHAVAAILRERRDLGERSTLRVVRSCSAAPAPALLHELEAALRVPVVEAYGMTEAAHQIASNPLEPGRRKPGSVGRAVGTEIAIRGHEGAPAPTGSRGEIVIRGENVFRGYERGGAGTADGFADGWLRTGDEGYLDAEGFLFIRGRIKELINRGGEKIAPREIDEALAGHPAIAEAAAFAIPHPTLGEDVAVSVVPRPGREFVAASVRDYLADKLADFKIPREVVVADRLPKTASGKLDRLALARAYAARRDATADSAASESAPIVAGIFSGVLGLDAVGLDDNFFALGGDSIRANMVLARIEARFGIKLPVMGFFSAPTVEGIARLLDEKRGAGRATHVER
jgi:acyl-CoA synthetase (AMP-forming)/AMP-acid ligase II/acyl carrier protein